MRSIPELLSEHRFFHNLPGDALDLIAGCGHNVHFDSDERIFSVGEPADVFYLVRTGKVALELDAPQRGPLIIDTVGPGELLGVSWLLPPYRWTFDARALESTSAIAMDAACLRQKLDDDPTLGYEMYKRFAGVVRERLQATRFQLIDVYGHVAS